MPLQTNGNGLRPSFLPAQFDLLVNKSRKVLNRVQKGLKLELNGWSPFAWLVCCWQTQTKSNPGRSATPYSSCLFFSDFRYPPESACATVKTSSWGRARRKIQDRCDGLAPKKSAQAKPSAALIISAYRGFCLWCIFLVKLPSGGLGSLNTTMPGVLCPASSSLLRFLTRGLTHRLCYRAELPHPPQHK